MSKSCHGRDIEKPVLREITTSQIQEIEREAKRGREVEGPLKPPFKGGFKGNHSRVILQGGA